MGAATQYTVNNQMVNATLMNIADNPTNVQLPGVYKVSISLLYALHLYLKPIVIPDGIIRCASKIILVRPVPPSWSALNQAQSCKTCSLAIR